MIIYTGGTFDLFHAGHVNFLARCAQFGKVIVGLNTDQFVKNYKGKAPVCSYEERATVLLSCRYVDAVVENIGGADSRPVIEQVMPDVIAIGSDWARRDYYAQMNFDQDFLDDNEIGMLYLPYTQGISSTDIKARL